MTPDELRGLLDDAAEPGWDDDVRACSALYAGHRRAARRRHARTVIGTSAGSALLGAGVFLLLPGVAAPTTEVVLGCGRGAVSTGQGVVSAGPEGVTLAVNNPTDQVLPVVSGRSTVLAAPGASSVTLPLGEGRTSVRCGTGAPVALTVQRLVAAHCLSVSTALDPSVETGSLAALTVARLGALPAGAVVDGGDLAAAVRHVQVRENGTVVAEAVWHAMPAEGNWHLESLSHCS